MGSLRFLFLLLGCTFSSSFIAQESEPILLRNPSFEGIPAEGSVNGDMISGWYDCGFPGESIPDIHPKEGSTFKVETKPSHGNTYIGLVVRDNDTWERVSQRLDRPMVAGQCYEFSIYLSRSLIYESPSRKSSQPVNFVTPAKLRIWGGNSICGRDELLDESDPVITSRWLINQFQFKPKRNYQYIIFEAFYNTPTPFPYNGNILMDNASAILPVPCDDTLVSLDPVPSAIPNKPDEPSAPTKTSTSSETTNAAPPKILNDLDRSKITKGQIIQIDQLYFKSDSFAITSPSYPVLEEIHEFLVSNPDVKVEIGGHTNNIPSHEYCDNLSTKRAKAVADFLISRGIPKDRIEFKGYGKRTPIVSNSTVFGRKKNQRVEIKILGFDGDGDG